MSTAISVALGARSYQIHVGSGLLARAGRLVAPFAPSSRRIAVVTDEMVAKLHYPALAASLEEARLAPAPLVLPVGERNKSFAGLESLVDALLAANVERDGLIVALGGGVIGDLAGFAAGVFKRGVAIAQIPTTLLAQVDSAIGGKTGINTAQGKNLVGVFHQPRIVIADTSVLATLPRRELLGGYAEIAKCALLGDAAFFVWLEKHAPSALAGDAPALTRSVTRACEMKAAIVARDEREAVNADARAMLNLGHTFGHALEAATGYSERLSHGEAVAIGCTLAFRLSERLGHCAKSEVARVGAHLSGLGLPTRIAQIPGPRPALEELMRHMRHDKKAVDSRLTFILVRGVGKAFVARDVPEEAVRALLGAD